MLNEMLTRECWRMPMRRPGNSGEWPTTEAKGFWETHSKEFWEFWRMPKQAKEFWRIPLPRLGNSGECQCAKEFWRIPLLKFAFDGWGREGVLVGRKDGVPTLIDVRFVLIGDGIVPDCR